MRFLVPLAAVAAAALAYHRLRATFFYADDFLHLYGAANGDTASQLFVPYGGHILTAWYGAVWLFYTLAGPDALVAGSIALGTHVVNTALLWSVVRRLTGAPRLAATMATCWGVSFVHDGALGWYSVYGQVLATTLLLVTLRSVLVQREQTGVVPWVRLAGWWIAQATAATCFGIGLAAALVFPLAAILLLPPRALDRPRLLVLCSLPVALMACWIAAMWTTFGVMGAGEGSLGSKVLAMSIITTPTFLLDLLGAGASYLALGPIARAPLYPGRIGMAAAAAIGILVAIAFWRQAGSRRTLAGLLLLTVVAYGSIAAGRAALYAALSGLAKSPHYGPTQTRYHYFGTALLAAVVGAAAAPLVAGAATPLATGAFVTFIVATATGLIVAPLPLDHHDRSRQGVMRVLTTARIRALRAPVGATIRVPNRFFSEMGPMAASNFVAFPGWAAIFVTWRPDGTMDGRHVVFEIDDPAALATLQARPHSPIARVVTAPTPKPRSD